MNMPLLLEAARPVGFVLRLLGYIDPGTGSLVIQVVVGTVVGALVTAKLYWQRLRAFFVRSKASDDDSKHEAAK